MAHDPKCPDCGATLTGEQAESGICPRCAMRLALHATAERGDSPEPDAEPEPVPERIGSYRVIRPLGEGGMGVVYLAEQREPIRREVAVKVVKRGMDTKHVLARFEQERQAMALMDHPAIAQIFEAGATEEGRPYFAMEYVQGEPITDYADRWRLTLVERLQLFGQVCAGVQHAHQKGVIHRDIKPSNVMVVRQGDEALPKIIDFGVAKATSKQLTEETLFTELGIMIGTPEYMSPEQAEVSALDVDTRSDVYSLGVLLYELLTGVLPFDSAELRRGGHEEIRRRIREEEPALPSSRVSTLGDAVTDAARTRRVDPPSLSRLLRGDLDWIVLKSLAKEPERRYGTPSELAADLHRYLIDEPVVARPPSAVYRVKKFATRNKILVGSVVVVTVSLIAGAIGTTIFGLREARQRRETEAARADLEQVVEFQQGMLSDVDPRQSGERLLERLRAIVETSHEDESAATEALAAFDRAIGRVNAADAALGLLDEDILAVASDEAGERFAERPLIEAQIRDSIAWTYRGLALFEQAVLQMNRALKIARDELGPSDPQTIRYEGRMGTIYLDYGKPDEAAPLLEGALDRCKEVRGPRHPETLGAMRNVALLRGAQGRYEESVALYEELMPLYEEVLGERHEQTVDNLGQIGTSLSRAGRYVDGEPVLRKHIAILEETRAREDVLLLRQRHNLATAIRQQGRAEEALPISQEVVEIGRRALGERHVDTVMFVVGLAVTHSTLGDHDAAVRELRRALTAEEFVARDETQSSLSARMNLARVLAMQKKHGESADEFARALAGMRANHGDTHPITIGVLIQLRGSLLQGGRIAAAKTSQRELISARQAILDATPEDPAACRELAFELAGGPFPSLRDRQRGLELAIKANELTAYRQFKELRTLAIAYGASPDPIDVDKAIEYQQKAIEAGPDSGRWPATLESELERYEAMRGESGS